MTREEAIAYGKRVIDLGLNDETQKFCEMAIEALEQEPCEDCISRQAVIDMLENINAETEGVGFYYEHYVEYIKKLSSVKPQEPKTGHWIPMGIVDENGNGNYECSECHHSDVQAASMTVPYCWFCGARMIKPQESEG